MSPPHILVVEDRSIEALQIKKRLAKLGYEIISLVDSSEESLTHAAEENPDIVLLDFLHDVETPDKLIQERIKKVFDIPVLFVASKKSDPEIDPSVKLSPAGFLLKPFDDQELKIAVESAMDRNRIRLSEERELAKKKTVNWDEKSQSHKASPAKSDIATTKKGEAEALAFIRQIPTFKKLPEDSLKQLVKRSQFADVASGEYIAFEGDQDEASFIVVSGRFAMTKTATSGKELVVELLGPGDFLGMVFTIEQVPSELSARAQCNSEILWIQTSYLLSVLKEHPELYKAFAEHLAHCLHSSHDLSHALAHDSVKVRVAALLLTLVAKFSRIQKQRGGAVVLDITRQQIADLTGTTPETATRVTRAMHLDEIIDCGKPGVITILDIKALREITENMCGDN